MSNYKPRQPVGEETSLKIGYKGRHTRQHRLAGGPLPIRIASPRAGLHLSRLAAKPRGSQLYRCAEIFLI